MPKQPQRQTNPHQTCQIAIRIPGWFKNQIIDHCTKHQIPLHQFVANAVRVALLEDRGVPVPPVGRSLPTTADEIRAYVGGERLLTPCGREGVCAGLEPDVLSGLGFCGECGIRVF